MGLFSQIFGNRESEKFGDSVVGLFTREYGEIVRENPNQSPVEHLVKLWVGNYSREPQKFASYLTPEVVEYVTCLHACIPQPDCGTALSVAMLSASHPQLVAKHSDFERFYAEFMTPIHVLLLTENFEELNALFNLQNPSYGKKSPFPYGGKGWWETTKRFGLVSSVAGINAKDNSGETALMQASKRGYVEVIKLLLGKGADLSAKNTDGSTALMLAAHRGHVQVVNLLLEKGADINMKNTVGGTALMVVAQNGQAEIAKLLLDKGADIHAKKADGLTALFLATINGHVEVVKVLLAKVADINEKNKNGVTALMLAAYNGLVEVVRPLLAKGADINAKDIDGTTALITAALKGHVEVVKLLLAENADVSAKRKDGLTALAAALKGPGFKTVVARSVIATLLRQAGAKE